MNELIQNIDKDSETVDIPPVTRYIGEFACFNGRLTELNLESTRIVSISKFAFSHCYNLSKIGFPSSLTTICERAFQNCQKLKRLIFKSDSNLRKIESRAFRNCFLLEKVELPPLIEVVEELAFDQCNLLTKVDFRHTNIRKLGSNVFGRIRRTLILLPSTVSASDILSNLNCQIVIDEKHPEIQKVSNRYNIANSTIFNYKSVSKHVLIRRGVEKIADLSFFSAKLLSLVIPASVLVICESAFHYCSNLKMLQFVKDSRLSEIQSKAFCYCSSLKRVVFPRSLKIIRSESFLMCQLLEHVVFPHDSQLELIEDAFPETAIKKLDLPSSIRKIHSVCGIMQALESIKVNNDLFVSNEDGTAIFSKDKSELICVINSLTSFEIPNTVKVIKTLAFYCSSISGQIMIPASVEVIEEKAFIYLRAKIIEFETGSRLKSLAFGSFNSLEDLIINNENFVKSDEGVVMSLNPRGIVFVPNRLTELDIREDIEVIFSCSFCKTRIRSLHFPKSLKKICWAAFQNSELESVTFEDGTELDFIDDAAFLDSSVSSIVLPKIKNKFGQCVFGVSLEILEFPSNFHPLVLDEGCISLCCDLTTVVCPRSSLASVACINIDDDVPIRIIEDK